MKHWVTFSTINFLPAWKSSPFPGNTIMFTPGENKLKALYPTAYCCELYNDALWTSSVDHTSTKIKMRIALYPTNWQFYNLLPYRWWMKRVKIIPSLLLFLAIKFSNFSKTRMATALMLSAFQFISVFYLSWRFWGHSSVVYKLPYFCWMIVMTIWKIKFWAKIINFIFYIFNLFPIIILYISSTITQTWKICISKKHESKVKYGKIRM